MSARIGKSKCAVALLIAMGCEPRFVSMGDASETGVAGAHPEGGAGSTSFAGKGGKANRGGASHSGAAGAAGSSPAYCEPARCGPMATLDADTSNEWQNGAWRLELCLNQQCLSGTLAFDATDVGKPVAELASSGEDGLHVVTTSRRIDAQTTRLSSAIYLTQDERYTRLHDGDSLTLTLYDATATRRTQITKAIGYTLENRSCWNCLSAKFYDLPANLVRRRVTQVATTLSHACAIADDRLYCWGNNAWGTLGDGTTDDSATPVAVTALPGTPLAVALGTDHSCATTTEGAYCWGNIEDSFALVPQRIDLGGAAPSSVLAAVYGATCMGISRGVKCWGSADYQPLNLDITPRMLSGMYGHFCALSAEGAAYCWGERYYGELGDTTQTTNSTASAVAGLESNVTSISAGRRQSCAVRDGEAFCWGSNQYGELGDETTSAHSSPVRVGRLPGEVKMISTGLEATCAVSDGAIYCWGNNARGQLGDGTTEQSFTPVRIHGLSSGAQTVSIGYRFACAIANERVFCWGSNENATVGSLAADGSCSGVACSLWPLEVLFP